MSMRGEPIRAAFPGAVDWQDQGRPALGEPMRRLEDARFVTGSAIFIDDIALPNMLHAAVLRSPYAHARIRSMATDDAAALAGVRLVLTSRELVAAGLTTIPLDIPPPGRSVASMAAFEQPILAGKAVRYVGEPVAFVVAESATLARDAAEAVAVDYEELPARIGISQESPRDGDTVFRFEEGDADATEAAFATAARRIRAVLHNNRVHAMPIEPRGAIGAYDIDDASFTLRVGTQRVHILQRALADRVFRVPRDRMRVIAPDTGGGFGQKNGLYPEYVLCLEAARRLGQPVKWISGRGEALASDNHGRGNVFVAEAALDASDKILAIRAERIIDIGAFAAPRGMIPVNNGLSHLTGVYRVPAAHVTVTGHTTNTGTTSPYRGAGRPENVFCCERLIDIVAREIGCDPIAFRRLNLLSVAAMPWLSPLGTHFADVDVTLALDEALRLIDHAGFAERRAVAKANGRLAGLGVALFAEDLHGSMEPITVRIAHANGRLAVFTGTGSAGHGHETVFLQIVSQRLGLPVDRLDFVQSDTRAVPDGIGTAASWSATLGGSSALIAADAAIARATDIAAGLLGLASDEVTFADGLFQSIATNRTADWNDILAADPAFSVTGAFEGHGQSVSIGCHACEVEVDPDTGAVAITRAAIFQDCGRVLNPLIVEGQLHGGFAQGVGQGWLEEIVHDAESGQLVSGELTDYALPRADHFPPIATSLGHMPTTDNPLGVKGIGESAATGATPAFVNAVVDALAPLGIVDLPPPLTPRVIRGAIANAMTRGES